MKNYINLINVKHWIKNGFILAPVFFSFSFFYTDLILKTVLAFTAFCFASSVVYIINGIKDREVDKMHPDKKDRPIAAGNISVRKALIIMFIMLALCAISGLLCCIPVTIITGIYIVINIFYSLKLKNIPVLDVHIIALGFLLRVLAGSFAVGVASSDWMLLTTFFLALFLGFCKRRGEFIILKDNRSLHRQVYKLYSLEILNILVVICAALTVIAYALYAIDPETTARFGAGRMVYSVPFVVFGIFKYLMKIFTTEVSGDPVEIVLKDKVILTVVFLWGCLILAFILIQHFGLV